MEKQHFQILLYVIFGLLVVIGFGSLALYGLLVRDKPADPDRLNRESPEVVVVIWGTVDSSFVKPLINKLPKNGYDSVVYVEKSSELIRDDYEAAVTYDKRIPDLFLLESGEVFSFESVLRTVPFGHGMLHSVADYQRVFVSMTNIFLRPGGYLALPILSDSFVLFYNENLRRRNGLQELPAAWSDFTEGAYSKIIKKYKNTETAVIPLGAYNNYANASYLFATLFLQAKEGRYEGTSISSLLDFYTKFSNPRASVYTWSETFLDARSKFVGGQLLFYPGFVSEYSALRRSNPNIVVRATPLPQIYPGYAEAVPAKLYALAITLKGRQFVPALRVLTDMASLVSTSPLQVFDAVKLTPPVQNPIDTALIPCVKNSQCPSNSCNPDTRTCDLLPADARCTRNDQCSSNSCNPITNTCDLAPQRIADLEVFVEALNPSKYVPLTSGEHSALLQAIKRIVIGLETPLQAQEFVQSLFR